MKRTIIALVSTLLLAACEAPTDQEVVASSPTVASDAKFSWEKSTSGNSAAPSASLEAPKDTTKARILEIREGSGLIALAMAEKPAVHAHLQIIKDNKVLLVDVASTNETQVVVNVIPNQLKRPELIVGDEVLCTPAAAPAVQ
ncbi:MAG: hypothetical protein EBQ49_04595 [Verrucomicrobia bacterium]|jgi:hypothetical protein|nr:hypothetical protein [Verrucomicrobiota bacterium]